MDAANFVLVALPATVRVKPAIVAVQENSNDRFLVRLDFLCSYLNFDLIKATVGIRHQKLVRLAVISKQCH
ncbi:MULTISPECIES: hypothetical protein [unclassified Microcoleus]|uniref:hypothetical protein n=1 Tax=unclassified Microcoleus TaxID=2642155 RepID=UPI002FCFCA38